MEEIILKFNSFSVEEQNKIINKYKDLLIEYYNKIIIDDNQLKYVVYCLNYLVNYINDNLKESDLNIKSWCGYLLLQKLKQNSIKNENEIIELINKIVNHFNNENYNLYLSDIEIYVDEFYRDIEYIKRLEI